MAPLCSPPDITEPSVSAPGPSASQDALLPSASRLPDMDVFSTFGEVQPGNLPLLIRMPDGMCEQVEVPLTSTIDDLKSTLQRTSNNDLRFSFGNVELDPSESLLNTNIVDAYEHAGSLLHVIGSSKQDADTKAAALDSACAVVESISNGIKDMEVLCEIAVNPEPFPNISFDADGQSSQPLSLQRATPNASADAVQVEPTISSQTVDAPEEPPAPGAATPSALAHSLSRRLPNLFPPAAAAAAFPPGSEPAEATADKSNVPTVASQSKPTNVPQPQIAQPSIASIREARRKAREVARSTDTLPSTEDVTQHHDSRIGISTYAHPLPDGVHEESVPSAKVNADAKGVHNGTQSSQPSVVLAQSGKTTWLDDVMKTWEVGAVRQSGVLEKEKDGQEIHQYFDGLEKEAEREIGSNENPSGEGNVDADRHEDGESSDDDDDDEDHVGHTDKNGKASQSSAHGKRTDTPMWDARPQDLTPAVNKSAEKPVSRPSTTSAAQVPKWLPVDPRSKWGAASSKDKASVTPIAPSLPLPPPGAPGQAAAHRMGKGLASALQTPSTRTSSLSATSGSTMDTTDCGQTSAPSSAQPLGMPRRRQAAKIAPAPIVGGSPLPIAVANGGMLTPTFQGYPPPPGTWGQPSVVPVGPKKRGRKRKNPELTEEERALVRKEQNRESARLSRVRRKVIAAEYEGRLSELVNENSSLRKQVEGLNNRLAYLQSILTVTVRQEAPNRQ